MGTKVISDSTGEVFEVKDSDLRWKETGRDERNMGAEVFYEASVMFTARDGSTVTYTEEASVYPEGSPREVYNTRVAGGEIAED